MQLLIPDRIASHRIASFAAWRRDNLGWHCPGCARPQSRNTTHQIGTRSPTLQSGGKRQLQSRTRLGGRAPRGFTVGVIRGIRGDARRFEPAVDARPSSVFSWPNPSTRSQLSARILRKVTATVSSSWHPSARPLPSLPATSRSYRMTTCYRILSPRTT